MLQSTHSPGAPRRSYGGVSACPRRGALVGGRAVAGPTGPGRFPGFTYHGGPVLRSPQVRTSYWGPLWSDVAHQARAERFDLFLKDLLQSQYMNVLSQYGVGRGVLVGRNLFPYVPNRLTDTAIQGIIQAQIRTQVIPEPETASDMALIIYLDESVSVQDTSIVMCAPSSENAFGYHNFFLSTAGNPVYYAVIPSISDACVQQTCPDKSRGSLNLTQTQEQRQTQVTSHLFAEMATDPELNAWFDPDPQNGENGDIANGESATLVVGENTWIVQRTYSKYEDMRTQGAEYSVSEALYPLPALSDAMLLSQTPCASG